MENLEKTSKINKKSMKMPCSPTFYKDLGKDLGEDPCDKLSEKNTREKTFTKLLINIYTTIFIKNGEPRKTSKINKKSMKKISCSPTFYKNFYEI